MSEHDLELEGDDIKSDVTVVEEEIPQNLIDQIRAKRQELLENTTCFISIPGYEEIGLVAQYRMMTAKEIETIASKSKKDKDKVRRGMNIAIDTLIEACGGLYLIREDGAAIPFDPNKRGMALGYEKELADFLGFEAVAARQVLRGLFGESDTMISGHAVKLQRWFMNTSRDADEELLGDS